MLNLLRKNLGTGIVTTRYPATPPEVSRAARGRPEIDWPKWADARPAAAICPTGAIYQLNPDGTHARMVAGPSPTPAGGNAGELESVRASARPGGDLATLKSGDAGEALGRQIRARADRMFGRSLHIREVDAGSCNGCEVEIVGLNSPVYDLERFGMHFVASPRHADMLLVTGPVTRNMELALKKTYDAVPEPRLVVAVGACGCSGGIFGVNYATVGSVDAVIPVDVYIPGCPPNPHALLHGILLAMGRRPVRARP